MKNTFKVFGIIVFVTVIGFSFAACDNGTTNNNGGDDGNTEGLVWPDNLTGTWTKDDNTNITKVTFGVEPHTDSSSGQLVDWPIMLFFRETYPEEPYFYALNEIRGNNVYLVSEERIGRYISRLITLTLGTDGKLTVAFDEEGSLEIEYEPLEVRNRSIEGAYTKQVTE